MNLSFRTGETFKTKENVDQSILYCIKRESKDVNFILNLLTKKDQHILLKTITIIIIMVPI